MKLLSVNTGLPREVLWNGESVLTGIFKSPVQGRIPLRKLNLDGDRQADLTVHGGEHKAVYCYPVDHYDYWRRELPSHNAASTRTNPGPANDDLPMGSFGENFTIADSPLEDAVCLGDRFAVGTAEIVVTQPRLPCYKLIIKFGIDDMIKRFLSSGRTGFYVLVAREGDVGTGDEIRLLARGRNAIPVSEITRLYLAKHYSGDDLATIGRILEIASVPGSWKHHFRNRLQIARLEAHI